MTCHDKNEERARRFREAALPCLDDAYTLARYLMRNPTDAEDAVQECFLRALRHFDSWQGDTKKGDSIKSWLFAILRNVCYAELGHRHRQQVPTDFADDAHSAEQPVWQEPQPLPESAMLERQQSAAVRQLIDALPAPFREAILLREFNEMSYREIAQATGVPVGTVMSRLARARAMFVAGWKARDRTPRQQGGARVAARTRAVRASLAGS
jgi:RNA polymerase sigma-70 factor (ECF subfamily)